MLSQVVKKNILLLLRSKSSAFVIVFGPLFIILLVGLAFTTPSTYELMIGYHAPEPSELTTRFVNNMEEQGFVVESYDNIDECKELIQHGSIQACILFPYNFSLENGRTNNVTFYVDQSRTNFVYQIIDAVSKNIGGESAELSKDMTNSILDILWSTETGINDAVAEVVKLKAGTSSLASGSVSAAEKASEIELDEVDVDTGAIEDEFTSLKYKGKSLVKESRDVIDDAQFDNLTIDTSDFIDAVDALDDAVNGSEDNETEDFADVLDNLVAQIDNVNNQINNAVDSQDETITLLGDLKKDAEKLRDNLDTLKKDLEALTGNINTLKVTSSETISNPINTIIEPVTSNSSKLAYMFPYLLMLVVMFIGVLLSGTIIIMEKKSKASFRTFCTPTTEELFMTGNFVTSFVVIFLQMIILLGLAYYFLGTALVGNIFVSVVILLLGMIFFILLGMSVGYFLNTQESVTMVSISLASIFLFLSNLILPLETLSTSLRQITSYNPYVLTSEALRKALLFSSDYQSLKAEIWLLVGYSAVLLIIIILIQDLMKHRLLSQLSFKRHRRLFEDPTDLYLLIGRRYIRNVEELTRWLDAVDDKLFLHFLGSKAIRVWLRRNHFGSWLRMRIFFIGNKRQKINKALKQWLRHHQSKK